MKTYLTILSSALLVVTFVAGQGPDDNGAQPPADVVVPVAAAAAAAGSNDVKNPCGCQCNSYTYACNSPSGECGNCKSRFQGKSWCYISQNARSNCRDTTISRSGRAYSFEACITPTQTSSKCSCLANNGIKKQTICECLCPPGSPSSCFNTWC